MSEDTKVDETNEATAKSEAKEEPEAQAANLEAASPEAATAEDAESGHKVELAVVNGDEEVKPSGTGTSVKAARFAPLPQGSESGEQNSMDLLLDVELNLSVELGRASIPMRDVLQLGPGSIVELEKLAGEPVDILVNGKLVAKGEVVVVDENFGVRVTEIVMAEERLGQAA